MPLVFQIFSIDANKCSFSVSRAGCGSFTVHGSHVKESWVSALVSAQISSPVTRLWHVSLIPEGWISTHAVCDHFCFRAVIRIKINEAAIKITTYCHTLIFFSVESRAPSISFSSGKRQQYNLALKCHFVIGSFPRFFSCNQPHHALCSPTSSLPSRQCCNWELLPLLPPSSSFPYKQTRPGLWCAHPSLCPVLFLCLSSSSSFGGSSEILPLLDHPDLHCHDFIFFFVTFSYLSSNSWLPVTDFLFSLEYTGAFRMGHQAFLLQLLQEVPVYSYVPLNRNPAFLSGEKSGFKHWSIEKNLYLYFEVPAIFHL